MVITHNNIDDHEDHQKIWLKLSNGDQVLVYDNNDGYGSVEIVRHDHSHKSEVKSSTGRAHVLGRGRIKKFRNTLTKDREIFISEGGEDKYRRTSIELTHFYPR
jgi:hypothetical protein